MNNQEYDGPVLNIGIEVVLIPRKNGPLQDIDYCRFLIMEFYGYNIKILFTHLQLHLYDVHI